MNLTQMEKSGLQACAKNPRGYLWMATTMASLERKGMVFGQDTPSGRAYFLTEDGRRELKRGSK